METTLQEFQKLSKPKMVIKIIETMVQQGWDIGNFIYNFRSYTKEELIKNYKNLLNYGEKN